MRTTHFIDRVVEPAVNVPLDDLEKLTNGERPFDQGFLTLIHKIFSFDTHRQS